MSQILQVNSNGISQGINAPGFFVNKKSSFSMAYIPRRPEEILSLQMLFDQVCTKRYNSVITYQIQHLDSIHVVVFCFLTGLIPLNYGSSPALAETD